MNCFVYARVSTDRQADKDLSIPAQLEAMRQYAMGRDWQILKEFVEPGVSGRSADRPVLRRLLARCRDADPKVNVIFSSQDRSTRQERCGSCGHSRSVAEGRNPTGVGHREFGRLGVGSAG